MDDLIRQAVAWPWTDSKPHDHVPPDLTDDYAGRVIALLIERLGGSVSLAAEQIRDVADRLIVVPVESEDGLEFQVRALAR